MKNNNQERASLLRDVSMYHCIRRKQLYKLYPGKRAVVKKLLAYLVREGRINQVGNYYCDAPESMEELDRSMIDAIWVLIDFIDRVEYHGVGTYPVKLIFCADGEVYEIIHAGVGKETLVSYLAAERKRNEMESKIIVLVDKPEQIEDLQIDDALAYCTVSPEGEVQYYQKE